MNRWSQRCYRYGPAVTLSLLISLLSLMPARCFLHFSGPQSIPGMDKLVHALMYATFSLSLYHALSQEARRRPGPLLAIAAAASLFGAGMECGQGVLTRSRALDPLDAFANTAGAFGVILFIMLHARIFRSSHE